MGKPKQRLKLGRKSFLEIIAATARKPGLPVSIIEKDIVPGGGPMGGVVTAFRENPCDAGLFLSCDMPLLDHEWLRELIRVYEARGRAVFTEDNGLAGFPFIIASNSLGKIEQCLRSGASSIQDAAERLDARRLSIGTNRKHELLNVNTPEDYRAAQKLWEKEQRRRRETVLEVKGINVRRGSAHLVRDFNWKIARGEHWVILGANGSGKTTLLSALLGYITATSGEISILGEEYGEADWPELRRQIGLVSSSVRQMMPETEPAWITVASGKNAMIDYWGTPKRPERKAALGILKLIECEHLAERPWAVLSQGERQRVLIGRALMANPPLLILDEPCAGLDPAAREKFLQFLDRLGRGKNAPSLVLVTHHVEEIMPVFTHTLLLKEGRKLEEGPVRAMMRSDLLSKTFSSQITLRKSAGRYRLSVRNTGSHIL
jgi:iron complex transport system ATP-binding protein